MTEGKHIHYIKFEFIAIKSDIAGVSEANDQFSKYCMVSQ